MIFCWISGNQSRSRGNSAKTGCVSPHPAGSRTQWWKDTSLPMPCEKARFLGYEIHILRADDKHDHRVNAASTAGRVSCSRKRENARCANYMQGKPIHRRSESTMMSIASWPNTKRSIAELSNTTAWLTTSTHWKKPTSHGIIAGEDPGKQVQNFVPENLPTISANYHHQRRYLQGTLVVVINRTKEAIRLIWSSPLRWNKWSHRDDDVK